MAYDVGVRSFLTGKGVDNGSIGYDQNSGHVTVNGQSFIKPSLNMAGTTYDNQQNLDSAFGNYQKQQPSPNQSNDLNSAIQPQGSGLQGSKNYAVSAYGNQQPTQPQGNNLQGLTQQYTNQTPYANPYAQQISDIMKQINDARQATQAPVDPYSSPQYAAQQAQQQKLALQSTRAAQESMGQSGFARSTNLADRAQHIQNDANTYMTTQAVPQIIAQLQAQHQQQYQNAMSQFNPLMQLSQQADTLHQQQQAQLADQVKFLTGQENWNKTYDAGRTDAANTNAINKGTLTGNFQDPNALTNDQIQAKLAANSAAYATSDPATQEALHKENVALAAMMGGTDTTGNGDYTYDPSKATNGSVRTIAGQTLDLNKMKDIAALTGMMPDGNGGMMKTSDQQQKDLTNEWNAADRIGTITPVLAQMYNLPEGTPTEKAKEFAATLAVQNRQADASMMSAGAAVKNADTNAANSTRSASNAEAAQSLAQAKFDYDKDPKNPDNVYKLASAQKAVADAQKADAAGAKVDSKTSTNNYYDAIKQMQANKATKDKAGIYVESIKDHLSDTDYKNLQKWVENNTFNPKK